MEEVECVPFLLVIGPPAPAGLWPPISFIGCSKTLLGLLVWLKTVPNLIVVLGTCRRLSLRGAGRLLMVAIHRFLGFMIVFFLPVCL